MGVLIFGLLVAAFIVLYACWEELDERLDKWLDEEPKK